MFPSKCGVAMLCKIWNFTGDKLYLDDRDHDYFLSRSHTCSIFMDKLRRSFRSSFRRKDNGNRDGESSGPGDVGSGQGNTRLWLADEDAVKSNNCCFDVKYLGSVEVRFYIHHALVMENW